jgi:hypothetical protein
MRFRHVVLALCPLFALSMSSFAHAGGGVDITQATDQQKKDAQDHYQKGAKAFEGRKFDEAYTEFSASYDVVRSPNAHMMMARALLELGQAARAYNELGLVEDESQGQDKYKSTIEKSQSLRAEAAKKIAVVTLKLSGDKTGPLQITIDDLTAPVDRPYGISPGKAVARAYRSGKMRDTEELVLKAGDEKTVELDLGPADVEPPKPVLDKPAPLVAPKKRAEPVDSSAGSGLVVSGAIITALGVSGMGVGGALYKLSSDDYDALVQQCGGDPAKGDATSCGTSKAVSDLRDSGKEKQTFAIAALVAGGATTALGLGLLMGGAVVSHDASKAADTARVDVDVKVGPGAVWVTGTF